LKVLQAVDGAAAMAASSSNIPAAAAADAEVYTYIHITGRHMGHFESLCFHTHLLGSLELYSCPPSYVLGPFQSVHHSLSE
jgi:hypothetical protein